MKKAKLVASAKPNCHKVRVKKRTFVYSRIRKRELSDDKCYVQLMKQVAKVTLRTVKQICQPKQPEENE